MSLGHEIMFPIRHCILYGGKGSSRGPLLHALSTSSGHPISSDIVNYIPQSWVLGIIHDSRIDLPSIFGEKY